MDYNQYKDDRGVYRTQSLFRECNVSKEVKEKYPPVFTLKEHSVDNLPSVRQLYLSFKDPTGYSFAKEVLGSYEHFKKLCELKWFKDHLNEWNEELEISLRSEGLRRIADIAENGEKDTSVMTAAKYLAEKGWEPKRGRPSKEEVEHTKRVEAGIQERVSADVIRLKGNS